MTGEAQVKLHQKDEDTTWFGILREDSGFPSFQDYGRYATLMAESSRSPLSLNGQQSGALDPRYPSLVSFVGETGTLTLAEDDDCLTTYLQVLVKALL